METLKSGDLAFYDGLTGLIPCKVLSIKGPSGNASSGQSISIRITARAYGYTKGETMYGIWGLHVIPRKSVNGRYRNRIRPYQVQSDL